MATFNSWREIAVVMGGGLLADGRLPPHVLPRCEAVLSMAGPAEQRLVIASSCFSLNCRPRLRENGLPRSEASAIAHWLRESGYPGTVLCEQQSHDTVGSVFFIFSLYAKYFNLEKIQFITSEFHSERVLAISALINTRVFSGRFEIKVMAVPDVGVTDARKQHESRSLERFKSMFGSTSGEQDFAERLFLQHDNYNEKFGSDQLLPENFLY